MRRSSRAIRPQPDHSVNAAPQRYRDFACPEGPAFFTSPTHGITMRCDGARDCEGVGPPGQAQCLPARIHRRNGARALGLTPRCSQNPVPGRTPEGPEIRSPRLDGFRVNHRRPIRTPLAVSGIFFGGNKAQRSEPFRRRRCRLRATSEDKSGVNSGRWTVSGPKTGPDISKKGPDLKIWPRLW